MFCIIQISTLTMNASLVTRKKDTLFFFFKREKRGHTWCGAPPAWGTPCWWGLEEQRGAGAHGSLGMPRSRRMEGTQAWPRSHQREEPGAARGPPSGLEGQRLFLPAQQDRGEEVVGRAGIKSWDEKVGRQEIEEMSKGLLWERGSLWSWGWEWEGPTPGGVAGFLWHPRPTAGWLRGLTRVPRTAQMDGAKDPGVTPPAWPPPASPPDTPQLCRGPQHLRSTQILTGLPPDTPTLAQADPPASVTLPSPLRVNSASIIRSSTIFLFLFLLILKVVVKYTYHVSS